VLFDIIEKKERERNEKNVVIWFRRKVRKDEKRKYTCAPYTVFCVRRGRKERKWLV